MVFLKGVGGQFFGVNIVTFKFIKFSITCGVRIKQHGSTDMYKGKAKITKQKSIKYKDVKKVFFS